jgi:hypothetical protein
MTIYSTLKIGNHHINHCEDYFVISEIGNNKTMCAVMDGCSMGTDSYFTSTLTGKLLRKISRELNYREFLSGESDSLKQILENVLKQLFSELRHFKNSLQLEREELLNTLLIAIIDTNDCSGEFLCVGDGLICINTHYIEYEQNDKPDYLGYHLNEDFNSWYENQQQRTSMKGIKDFSLATDGIFTFKKFDNKIYKDPGNLVDLLLVDTSNCEHQNMLERKLMEVQTEWGLMPTDDLAIIRGVL